MTTTDPSAPPANDPANPAPAPAPTPPQPPQPPEPKQPDRFAEERRRADAAEKRAKEAEDALAARERADAEQKGEWEKVATEEKTAHGQTQAELARVKAERMVERIAGKAQFNPVTDEKTGETTHSRFINPDEALALLPNSTDTTDEDAVTEALQKLATERPHLTRSEAPTALPTPSPTPSGGPGGPAPAGPPKLTREYVESLPIHEIQKLRKERPEEMNAVLAGS